MDWFLNINKTYKDLNKDSFSQCQITQNLKELYLQFKGWSKTSVSADEGFVTIISHIKFPLFNSFISEMHDISTLEKPLDDFTETVISREVPAMVWLPNEHEIVLQDSCLKERGYIETDISKSMCVDLTTLSRKISPIEQFDILPVTNVDMLRQWCDVFVQGYQLPLFLSEIFFEFYSIFGFSNSAKLKHFICFYNGVPVGTSSVFYGSEVAGVYNVSTVKSARKKGIGTQVTIHALLSALEYGFNIGVLISSKMAENIYQQIGFKVNGSYSIYSLIPNEELIE